MRDAVPNNTSSARICWWASVLRRTSPLLFLASAMNGDKRIVPLPSDGVGGVGSISGTNWNQKPCREGREHTHEIERCQD